MSIRRVFFGLFLLAAVLIVVPAGQVFAQGCVLIREHGPMFNPSEQPYSQKGSWIVSFSFRGSTADKHWNGTVEQLQRETLGTNVVNQQRSYDLGVTYGVTQRLSLTFAVPLISASWSIPSPISPVPGPRAVQHGSGLGDVSVTAKYWVFSTEHTNHNISFGLGLKLPTGNPAATDVFADITGNNIARRAVDQSVQPGDGGWGGILDVQGFQKLGPAYLFGGITYLSNPKDTNGTPSILQGLGIAITPANKDLSINSVPDQYLVRGGLSVATPIHGLSASLAGRWEGVPRYDLIGASHGFRRPGKEIFIEPGLFYSKGNATLNFSLPIAAYRNRLPNPYTGAPGDATFPDYLFLAGVTYRFHGR